MQNSSILTIIPARAGSKRVVNKNIKLLHGKPLIQWTIDAALQVSDLSEIMVSTDSKQISDIAESAGAKVPFIRPKKLAQDTSSSAAVVQHAIEYYRKQDQVFDYVLLLQPTSPLRTALHIQQAIDLCVGKQANGIVSVCKTEHSPLWANTITPDGDMSGFVPKQLLNVRSQDLPTYYRLNGAIYLAKVSAFEQENTFLLSEKLFSYHMDSESSVDIDEELDFDLAQLIMERKDKI